MDTDSLLLQCRYEDGHAVEEILNQALEQFCKNEGIPPTIRLKFEKYYKNHSLPLQEALYGLDD